METGEDKIFYEAQKFPLWLRLFLVFDVICFTCILPYAMLGGEQAASLYIGLTVGIVISLAVAILFFIVKLETKVCSEGLYVRMFPLHIRFIKFSAEDLTHYYSRIYRPILEYGGWGIRYGLGSGKAYNLRGNKGVQLILKSGKKLLIGSQKPDELVKAIDSLMKK